MMKAIALGAACLMLAAPLALAADQRALKSLKELDPQERLEQRCDLEAMERLARDKGGFKPDKVIAYTFADPDVKGNRMKAAGAVFRSKGEWYRLNYDCMAGADHLSVQSFDYHIGAVVPRADWPAHYLAED